MTDSSTLGTDSLLGLTLLLLLRQQPAHGYALAAGAKELGVPVSDPSRIYRVLRPMEAQGLLRFAWDLEDKGKGPPRKVYSLTRKGERYLDRRMVELRGWLALANGVYERATQNAKTR